MSQTGWVPDASPQASTGWVPDAPPKKDWLDNAADFARGLWSQISPAANIQGAAQIAAHPIGTYVADASKRQAIMDNAEADFKKGDYASGIARSLYGIIPFFGPQMEQAGTEIGTGNAAHGLGTSVGMGLQLSSPAIIKGAKAGIDALPDISDVRQAAADALTTQRGALKPIPNAVARIGGAALGSATGVPEGGLIGALTGPSALKALLGERTPIDPEEVFAERVSKGVESAKVRAAVREATAQQAAALGPEDPAWKPNKNSVLLVPEPNAPAVGEKPGSMYSVPRTQLVPAALRGKPGAADVLRDLGQPQIIIPRGASVE